MYCLLLFRTVTHGDLLEVFRKRHTLSVKLLVNELFTARTTKAEEKKKKKKKLTLSIARGELWPGHGSSYRPYRISPPLAEPPAPNFPP